MSLCPKPIVSVFNIGIKIVVSECVYVYVKFARKLAYQFNRWCSAFSVDTFDKLYSLVIHENRLPDSFALYINERKVKSPSEAAAVELSRLMSLF